MNTQTDQNRYIVQFRATRAEWFKSDCAYEDLVGAIRYIQTIVKNEVALNGRILDNQARAVVAVIPPITLRTELDPAITIPDDDQKLAQYLNHLETTLSDWGQYQTACTINQELAEAIAHHLTGEPWLLTSHILRWAVLQLNLIRG